MCVSVTPFCESYCEIGRGYVCILELSNATSNFLFKVSEAKEGSVSVSFRKYPILDTDSINNSICKIMRIGSSCLSPMSLYRRWQKFTEEKSRICKMG